ncbi:MAG: isocitrate lyase/phosphoenolpyruvate mutase family protein [Amylibacter sp.]
MDDLRLKKFEQFKALHFGEEAFVIPNPWDAGTARILTTLGFAALATTSAGYAFSVGRRDSLAGLGRSEVLENAAAIVQETELPVSADLEDGFGVAPEDCAETIRLAVQVGLVGGSIEDVTGAPDDPIYGVEPAVDRIKAAVQAAHGKGFLLTARAENYLWGRSDLKDTIKRLQLFSEAGADVLYAPGLPDLDAIRTVCREVDKPVNVVMGLQGTNYSVQELSDAGVKRISVGGSFARAALGEFVRAAQEVKSYGTFTYSDKAISSGDVTRMMSDVSLKNRK